jgi:hypothetical protein
VPRQSLTAALAEMKAADLLDFTASGIEVYDRRKLVELLDD